MPSDCDERGRLAMHSVERGCVYRKLAVKLRQVVL